MQVAIGRPTMRFSKVVFPAPEGPIKATISPDCTRPLTSSKSFRAPGDDQLRMTTEKKNMGYGHDMDMIYIYIYIFIRVIYVFVLYWWWVFPCISYLYFLRVWGHTSSKLGIPLRAEVGSSLSRWWSSVPLTRSWLVRVVQLELADADDESRAKQLRGGRGLSFKWPFRNAAGNRSWQTNINWKQGTNWTFDQLCNTKISTNYHKLQFKEWIGSQTTVQGMNWLSNVLRARFTVRLGSPTKSGWRWWRHPYGHVQPVVFGCAARSSRSTSGSTCVHPLHP